jgi:hypothetical protein
MCKDIDKIKFYFKLYLDYSNNEFDALVQKQPLLLTITVYIIYLIIDREHI